MNWTDINIEQPKEPKDRLNVDRYMVACSDRAYNYIEYEVVFIDGEFKNMGPYWEHECCWHDAKKGDYSNWETVEYVTDWAPSLKHPAEE
jgi:hypothetical protein